MVSFWQTLAGQLSYLHEPRPFKNPNYTKNINRRAKNLKTVLGQEREREKTEREARRIQREKEAIWNPRLLNEVVEEAPTCECCKLYFIDVCCSLYIADTMIEAPPSVIPHKHLCDITGLEVRVNFVTMIYWYWPVMAGTIHRSNDWIALSRQERLRNHQRTGEPHLQNYKRTYWPNRWPEHKYCKGLSVRFVYHESWIVHTNLFVYEARGVRSIVK